MQIQAEHDPDLSRKMQRLGKLLAEIERLGDPAMRARMREIVRTLMDFHGSALERLLCVLADAGPVGQRLIDEAAGDEQVSTMLSLYGLHPLDVEARVRGALEKVRPYLAKHAGNAELIGIDTEGTVTLRLEGNCHGCPSSRSTLKGLIEEAIFAAAPEVAGIRVEEGSDGQETPKPGEAGFLPLSAVRFNGCPLPAAGAA